MKHNNTLRSNIRLKKLKLFALFIGAIAICSPMVAAQGLPVDASTSDETLYGPLVWDTNTVAAYKQTLPITLRNRKIKHYALTAAVVGGVAGYIWYVNQDSAPTASATKSAPTAPAKEPASPAPKTGTPVLKKWPHNTGDMDFTADNFKKYCQAMQKLMPEKNSDWFLWADLGGWAFPYSPRLEPIVQTTKAVATWSIGSFAFNRATSIFSFCEDMPWFYNEEKSGNTRGKNLEALALNYDAAVATKQPNSVILLKKQALLESAHDYLDCLMSLYVFMEHRSAQVLAKFDPEIREKLQPRFTLQATSVMQNGIEFCQKLNYAVAKTAQSPLSATENARAVVMQTHNLMQAVVASFVRLEDLYNK